MKREIAHRCALPACLRVRFSMLRCGVGFDITRARCSAEYNLRLSSAAFSRAYAPRLFVICTIMRVTIPLGCVAAQQLASKLCRSAVCQPPQIPPPLSLRRGCCMGLPPTHQAAHPHAPPLKCFPDPRNFRKIAARRGETTCKCLNPAPDHARTTTQFWL